MKINFIDILVETYKKSVNKNQNYAHNIKYSIRDYFNEIIKFTSNSVYWRRYKGKIDGKTLNNKHNEFIKAGIYKKAYETILYKYISNNGINKMKYQIIDSLFIKNKFCCGNLGRNKYYKNKRGIKVSSIVDSTGIPISLICRKGQIYDSQLFKDTYNSIMIITKTKKYQEINKYKQYFLADKGYDTNNIRKLLKEKGYISIIDHNRRNIKDINKIKKLTKKEKYHYRKRLKVENFFAWLTLYPKMNMIVEKSIESFEGLVYLCSGIILNRRLNR